jgi:hypothetical protein
MVFNVLIFGFRAVNLSHDEYKEHYENVHVPLAQSFAGDTWPLSHTRHYYGGNKTHSTVSAPMGWDSMAVLTFRDKTHAVMFNGMLKTSAAAKAIHEDELKFMAEGSPKMVVIGTDWAVTVPS